MSENLKTHFQKIQTYELDKVSKKLLYSKIQGKISRHFGLKRVAILRGKLVSFVLVVVVLFSATQYTLLNSPITAQAENVGTVISRNGNYQIIFDNKQVALKEKDNQIPVWGSLVLEEGSQVKIKTKNDTTADIVGPAKLTFAKENNKLIVDVQYSQHIDIKKEESPKLAWQEKPEVLVIKSEKKLIVASNNAIDLSLDTQNNTTTIINNTWAIAITQIDTNKTIALHANSSMLLDSEIALFSKENDTPLLAIDKNRSSTSSNSENKNRDDQNNTKEKKWIELAQSKEISLSLKSKDISAILDQSSLVKENIKVATNERSWSSSLNTTHVALIVNNDKSTANQSADMTTLLKVEGEEDIIVNAPTGWDSIAWDITTQVNTSKITTDRSITELLDNKKILNPDAIYLLDALYKSSIAVDKDMSKITALVIKLCKNLEIACDEKDISYSVTMINSTIKKGYITTPDLKFTKL